MSHIQRQPGRRRTIIENLTNDRNMQKKQVGRCQPVVASPIPGVPKSGTLDFRYFSIRK